MDTSSHGHTSTCSAIRWSLLFQWYLYSPSPHKSNHHHLLLSMCGGDVSHWFGTSISSCQSACPVVLAPITLDASRLLFWMECPVNQKNERIFSSSDLAYLCLLNWWSRLFLHHLKTDRLHAFRLHAGCRTVESHQMGMRHQPQDSIQFSNWARYE